MIFLLDIKYLRGRREAFLPLLSMRRRRSALAKRTETGFLHTAAAGLLLRFAGIREDEEVLLLDGGKPVLRDGCFAVIPETVFPEEAEHCFSCFSLSHGGDFAALALAERPVGTDVEKISECRLSVAKTAFTEKEIAWAVQFPADGKERDKNECEVRAGTVGCPVRNPLLNPERFYAVWTMKESILKTDGRGITVPLRSVDVFSNPVKADYRIYKGHSVACASESGPDMRIREIGAPEMEMIFNKSK